MLLLGAAFVGLVYAVRQLGAPGRRPGGTILLGAAALRLVLLPLPLTLSDDALRYLWDGKVAMSGLNPYALPPAASELIPLRDEIWRRLPHSDVATVYPPLSIAAFSIATLTPFPLLAWKSLAAVTDLGTCALLLALARRRGIPEARTAWYAWNPLVILEVAGMGHVDALGVAALVATVLALTPGQGRRGHAAGGAHELACGSDSCAPSSRDVRRPWDRAAIGAAAGVLAKLAPLAALPMWARQSGRPFRFLAAALGLLAAAFLPVLAATGGIPPGLLRYGISWEFNGPVYEPLWRLLDAVGAAPALKSFLDHLKVWTGEYEAWNPLYPYIYPQLLAKALLALGMAAAVARSLREKDPVTGTGRLFGALLLLSPTVYPWYLLWVLPWAALTRNRAWLALSGLILLSYLTKMMELPLMPWIYFGIWGPFAVLWIRQTVTPSSLETSSSQGT